MIVVPAFAGCTVAVLGLARSGLAAARALAAGGARVVAWDDGAAMRERATAAGLAVADPRGWDWSGIAALVLSPGIPHTHPAPHPAAAAARSAGVEILGDVELLLRAWPGGRLVAVTGTNGKSTTTALIGHLLAAAGERVAVGGNLGLPVLELTPPGEAGIWVVELSSYQLELTPSLASDVAVLLNISADHLDRHGGMAGYVAAKALVLAAPRPGGTAVIGVDDAPSRALFGKTASGRGWTAIGVSVTGTSGAAVRVDDGILRDARDPGLAVDLRAVPTLPGPHNWQNAAAAWAACRALGIAPESLAAALPGFRGLPHRQERIAAIDGILYVNDSKATNGEAAARALACYDAVYWIAGGQAKAEGIDGLAALFPRIAHAFLIGEAAARFAATLAAHAVPHSLCGDLAQALAAADARARHERRKGAVVLLSPACASFDQFRDFEARGDSFRALVRALPGAEAEAAA